MILNTLGMSLGITRGIQFMPSVKYTKYLMFSLLFYLFTIISSSLFFAWWDDKGGGPGGGGRTVWLSTGADKIPGDFFRLWRFRESL